MGRLHRPNEPLAEALACGNIAHVLRQARASLKDPSRPYTPAERRLRSTECLFGEGGFRPPKTESGTAQWGNGNCRVRNGLSRKRSIPGHVPRLKKEAGKGQLKKHAVSSSRDDEIATASEVDRLPENWGRRGRAKPLEVLNATPQAAQQASSVVDEDVPVGFSHQRSSRSPTTDPGILYLDQGRPRGARSRSIVNRWNVSRRGRRTSSSSSSSSDSGCNSGGSSLRKNNKTAAVNTRKKDNPMLNSEGGEYEGLYGSDVDVDTTAWDLGFVHSGVSDDHDDEEEGEGARVVSPLHFSRAESDDGGFSDVDFVLDAIDNEVDLGVKGRGVENDEDDTRSEPADPPHNDTAYTHGASSRRDASPDPGTLEEERERNARLTGLLRMLRRTLFGASNEKPRGRRKDGVDNLTRSPATSTVSTARALEVLSRVMNRPPGSEDASSPSITELPALLAARSIVSLVLLSTNLDFGGAGCYRRARGTSADDGRAECRRRHGELLMEACRHTFEVSKRPGADEAFVSSGTLEGLMEFVELAASKLDSISAQAFSGEGKDAPKPSGGASRKSKDGRGADKDVSEGPVNCFSSSLGNASDSDTSGKHSDEGSTDGLGGGMGGGLWSMCDSLTFAVGCVKNLSAGEDVHDWLVRAGSVPALCRLARSTRDLCRRCELAHRNNRSTRISSGVLFADAHGNTTNVLDGSSAGSCGEQPGIDKEPRNWQGNAGVLRKHVSPFLAQAISLLRDLSVVGEKGRDDSLQAAGVVGTLCSILRPFRSHQDVILNTARVLAKLSLQERTRAEINSDASHMRDLLAALIEQGRGIGDGFSNLENNCVQIPSRAAAPLATVPVEHRRLWEIHEKRLATCVRIAFALGNLTSASDENRRLIGIRLGGAESLPALLLASSRAHLSAWERLCAVDRYDSAAAVVDGIAGRARGSSFLGKWSARATLRRACDGVEEMLVKTVRLLANISIYREVGQRVCRQPGLVVLEPLLDKCLELFGLSADGALPHQRRETDQSRRSERHEEMVPGEELLLNTVSLVTNLSFYGPGAHTPAIPPPPVRASPDESTATARYAAGSKEEIRGGRLEPTASLSSSSPPHASVLFALANKARRGLDEQEVTFATPHTAAVGVAPAVRRAHHGVCGGVARPTPAGASYPSGHPTTTRAAGENPVAGRNRREVLCGHLVKVLLHPNVEAVAEAARAFGNFSRDPSCRAAIAERRGDEVLVALLGHPCREVVFAAAGAIVNLAGDRACRARLCREGVGAGDRLARLVRRAGLADPGMAELACQGLHNLLMVEDEPPLGGGGRGGTVRDVLGGSGAYDKLWWTLKELTEACSSEGQVVGGRGGESSGELGRFLAAAKAVWGVMKEGRSMDRSLDGSLYEEL